MALQARIKSVKTTIETPELDEQGDPTGETVVTDLALSGQLLIEVDYIDSADPSTVLLEQSFQVSATEREDALVDRILGHGVRVRDAYIRRDELAVYIGQAFDLPEPEA